MAQLNKTPSKRTSYAVLRILHSSRSCIRVLDDGKTAEIKHPSLKVPQVKNSEFKFAGILDENTAGSEGGYKPIHTLVDSFRKYQRSSSIISFDDDGGSQNINRNLQHVFSAIDQLNNKYIFNNAVVEMDISIAEINGNKIIDLMNSNELNLSLDDGERGLNKQVKVQAYGEDELKITNLSKHRIRSAIEVFALIQKVEQCKQEKIMISLSFAEQTESGVIDQFSPFPPVLRFFSIKTMDPTAGSEAVSMNNFIFSLKNILRNNEKYCSSTRDSVMQRICCPPDSDICILLSVNPSPNKYKNALQKLSLFGNGFDTDINCFGFSKSPFTKSPAVFSAHRMTKERNSNGTQEKEKSIRINFDIQGTGFSPNRNYRNKINEKKKSQGCQVRIKSPVKVMKVKVKGMVSHQTKLSKEQLSVDKNNGNYYGIKTQIQDENDDISSHISISLSPMKEIEPTMKSMLKKSEDIKCVKPPLKQHFEYKNY